MHLTIQNEYFVWLGCIKIEVSAITHQKILILAQNVIFIILSVLVAFFIRIPLIPAMPFLTLEFSDVPVLVSTILYGYSSGICVLFLSLLLRLMLFSSTGFIGLIIRSTSIFLIFAIYFFKKNTLKLVSRVLLFILFLVLCVFVKIPLNYVSWLYLFKIPKELILPLMFSYVVPFNILKISINCVLALVLSTPCQRLLIKIFKTI